MQRLWSDNRISLITTDREFELKLTTHIANIDVLRIDPHEMAQVSALQWSQTLVLWDLRDLSSKVLREFLHQNSNFTRNCSLLLLADSPYEPGLEDLISEGAVDFVLRSISPDELGVRLRMARRPWVKALETAFEFLSALDVDLTMTEQKVFLCFLRNSELCAGRKDIMEKVWTGLKVHPNTLDVHLFNIRRKLETSGVRITFTARKSGWTLSKSSERTEAATKSAALAVSDPLRQGSLSAN